MDELLLKKPSIELADLIWEYRAEYFRYGEPNINGSCGIARYDDFNEWLELALSLEKDKSRNNVHASTFFSIRKSDNKVVGSIQLRHSLTAELEQHGGHIGYGIRPTERKKGYGKQQLSLVLDIARQMEIYRVLIICNKENIASAKTAISCGGIFSDENLYDNIPQLRYWIDL